MKILNGDNVEIEYNKFNTLKYLQDRCGNLKNSLRLVDKQKEHLVVRCPLTGEYLLLSGLVDEIEWLDEQLSNHDWYRKN